MATRKTNEPTPTPPPAESSRNALVVLTIGCLLVAGLVVWALTRTVEPSSPPPPVESSSTVPVADQTAFTPPPLTTTQPVPLPTDTASPIQISMNGGPPQAVPQGTTPQSLPQGAMTSDRNEVRRVAAEDLRDKVNAGQVTIIDVRDAASFATGHIPGAVNIPFASVQSQMQSLPRGKEIVTYCT